MCLCIMRRSLLRTAMLSPLTACHSVSPPAPVADGSPKRWIDVHCHVFNGTDVPLYEFIRHTRLSGAGSLVAAPMLALLAGGAQHDAPSPEDELQGFADRRTDFVQAGTLSLRRGVERLLEPRHGSDRSRVGEAAGPTPQEVRELVHRALREARIRGARDARGPNTPPTPDELDAFDSLQSDRSNIGTIVARYFAWGLMFAQPRDALVGRLAALYPGQQLMLTPAMVDYDLWLGAPDNDLPGQGRVMAAIAVKRARTGMPVHAFLGFDPWRCLRDRANGIDRLAQLRNSIESGTAIGVKLYPPMGFAAGDNSRRANSDFPDRLSNRGGSPGNQAVVVA